MKQRNKIISLFLFIVFGLLLTACATSFVQKEEQPSLTPAMLNAMVAHADEFDSLYPDAENVAWSCSQSNSDVYWNKDLKSYAVTCFLPSGGIGIVTFSDREILIDVFSISQDNLSGFLSMGWEH
jgi:hypothetical protein